MERDGPHSRRQNRINGIENRSMVQESMPAGSARVTDFHF
jgi:hypothetical protein